MNSCYTNIYVRWLKRKSLTPYSRISFFRDVFHPQNRIVQTVGHAVLLFHDSLSRIILLLKIIESLFTLVGVVVHDCSEFVDRIDFVLRDEMLVHRYLSDNVRIWLEQDYLHTKNKFHAKQQLNYCTILGRNVLRKCYRTTDLFVLLTMISKFGNILS